MEVIKVVEYKKVSGSVLSVEEIQGVNGHQRWAGIISLPTGETIKLLAVDWNDTGHCPFSVGQAQEFTYKDWISQQGAVYHNYVAPRQDSAAPIGTGHAQPARSPVDGKIKLVGIRHVGTDEYRAEIETTVPQVTTAAGVLRNALHILTPQPQPVGAPTAADGEDYPPC